MAYTEIQERNGEKYYYRVLSIRLGKKVAKKKIYMWKNLKWLELQEKENNADKEIIRKKFIEV